MQSLALGSPASQNDFQNWVQQSMQTIEQAHTENRAPIETLSTYSLPANFTPTRALTAASTLADVINFVCTMANDLRNVQ